MQFVRLKVLPSSALVYQTALILAFNFSCFANNSIGQTRADNWYFGNYIGIQFDGDSIIPLEDGQARNIECPITMSEENGDLYFYSGFEPRATQNQTALWNRNHEIMPNGHDIICGHSSTQGIASCLNPSNTKEHYIFTLEGTVTGSGQQTTLYYSILDHELDDGLGDIVTNKKNVLVKDSLVEKMAMVKKTNGSGYWLVIHQNPGIEIYVFSIDSNGFYTVPQVFYGSLAAEFLFGGRGGTKISSDRTKLVICQRVQGGKTEIFNFDASSGTISNPIIIEVPATIGASWPYGVEFSPHSNFLYATNPSTSLDDGTLYQWDVSSHDSISIASSLVIIKDSIALRGGLQLGPDSMIYATSYSGLHRIESPDLAGLGCNLSLDFIVFDTNEFRGLPYFPTFQMVINDTTSVTDSTISVQELNNTRPSVSYMDVYPNPTSSINWINIKAEGLIQIDLSDLSGRRIRTVYVGYVSNDNRIESDLSDLAPGVYVYALKTKHGTYNLKVIKE